MKRFGMLDRRGLHVEERLNENSNFTGVVHSVLWRMIGKSYVCTSYS
jgi:hypothetical protein